MLFVKFTTMIDRLYHIVTSKFWPALASHTKNKLFLLLSVAVVCLILSVVNIAFQLTQNLSTPEIFTNASIVLVIILANLCVINGRERCILNLTFTIPLFIYAFYISDFYSSAPLIETVYFSVMWLLAGLLFLLYFDSSDSRLFFYALVSVVTISFQLLKANRLFNDFTNYQPFIAHPVLVYLLVFGSAVLLRRKNNKIIKKLTEGLKYSNQSISKVMQDSGSSIAQLSAIRDEDGNVEKVKIERVNNAFESNFKKNLYEVKDQDASYIFNIIFKNQFDLNKTLFQKQRAPKEFYAKHLERWFRVHRLKPGASKFYLIFEDITKEKKKAAELEASKKRYKVLLEAIPDMYFVIDKDGTYEDFVVKENDRFKLEDVDIIGSTIYDVGFPDKMANKISSCIKSCIRNNSIESIEYSLDTPNGTFLYEMRLAKLSSRSVISVARDITKRKTAEFKLEKAMIKAEESDRLKSAFLANLSHEIRTPLGIITHFSRMLAEEEYQGLEKTEITDAIAQNGKQLLNMIDNTIHLSKIETQAVVIHNDFCAVNTVIRKIYTHFLPLMPESKNIRLKQLIDVPNREFGFKTDEHLLREVLSILVDNAIKYTFKGEIEFGYEMVKNEAVRFIVSDNGIGIPDEEKENIFSRFYRVKNKINETTSGSGLGLPIAKHYVKLLGGELRFESNANKGTRFWFALPFNEGKGFLKIVS